MGFKKGCFATVWEIKPRTDTLTSGRLSVSRLDKQTNEYVQDWGGFVSFCGTSCANKALGLKYGDRIKVGDIDITNKYDASRQVTYTNFNIFSFEMADSQNQQSNSSQAQASRAGDEGEMSDDLPF